MIKIRKYSNIKMFTDEQLKDDLLFGLETHEIASKYGVSTSAVRKRKRKLIKQGFSLEHDWVKEVPDGYQIKGVSTLYKCGVNEKGMPIRVPTNQWVKSQVDRDRQVELIKEACQTYIEKLPKYPAIECKNKDIEDDLMLVLPIGDLHVGMMSWKDETGNNWSIEHVKMAVFHVFKMLIEQAPNIAKILIINLGDFGHRDGKYAITPNSGNHLDVDSRYPKMAQTCVQLQRYIIELARKKAPLVEIVNVGGNHDQCLAIMLGECMANVYENEPRVIVNTSPAPVKYCEWGKVMIATTHGDTIKMDDLAGISANDQSEMWGRTKFRYGMTGHIHSSNKLSKELTGMEVESFRTLAPGDSYAAWYGWRSGQDSHGIIFHREFGARGRNIIPIIMIKEYLDKL